MANRRNPADHIAAFVEKIERRRVQTEQLDDLA